MAERSTSLSPRVIAGIVAVLLVANTALVYVISRQSENALIEQIHMRMLDVANSAAALLDGDSLATLQAEDAGTPAYEQAMDTLRAFQDNVELSYIYCTRELEDGNFEFTVDPTVGDPAEFGEPVAYTEALATAGRGTPAVDTVAYSDRWGRFYSAYSPVFDSKGKIAGVVGVDFSAAWYEERADFIDRVAVINCIVSLLMALLAVIVATRLSRAEANHMEKLLRANRYDALTGLVNMNYFLESAEEAHAEMLEAEQEPVMLYINLVDMKFFNHKYGFAEGDALLKAFAGLLVDRFGEGRCARVGQDHFAVATNREGLDERLDAFILDCERINEGRSVPVRIGIYPDSFGELSVSASCDRAKLASMAKRGGHRSTYTYFSMDMIAKETQRQHIIQSFDRALAENWIEVYYQPIVRVSTGRVCDEEALARWNDPEHGVLSPDEFVPVLEDERLIYKLDLYVVDQVLAKMQAFADRGLYVVPSSVNLSRYDFESCDIVEEIRARVDASPFGREKLSIEITESAMGRDFEFMRKQVERFHELGFQVWMDDFGSGYSSLDYLQNLNFDLIKLDMRFMQQFDSSDKSKVILTELVKMAFGLGVDTVVEGVERQDQVDFLLEVGCSKMQGFYFTKPIPSAEVLGRYEDGTAIGFENPAEAEYYSALGRVNLYDLSSIARGDTEGLAHYFDTLPMAILETMDDSFTIIRGNKSFRSFIEQSGSKMTVGRKVSFATVEQLGGNSMLDAIKRCCSQADRLNFDERMPDGSTAHAFMRRIAIDPITGAVAMVLVVLAVFKSEPGSPE